MIEEEGEEEDTWTAQVEEGKKRKKKLSHQRLFAKSPFL
jgi:hypothetical protein